MGYRRLALKNRSRVGKPHEGYSLVKSGGQARTTDKQNLNFIGKATTEQVLSPYKTGEK
jgi:hypothetical protein